MEREFITCKSNFFIEDGHPILDELPSGYLGAWSCTHEHDAMGCGKRAVVGAYDLDGTGLCEQHVHRIWKIHTRLIIRSKSRYRSYGNYSYLPKLFIPTSWPQTVRLSIWAHIKPLVRKIDSTWEEWLRNGMP